jgi:hypothetical protein
MNDATTTPRGSWRGPWTVAFCVAVGAVSLMAVHARSELATAQARLESTAGHARVVRLARQLAGELETRIDETRVAYDTYRRLVSAPSVSAITARLVNALPADVTLDLIEVEIGTDNLVDGPMTAVVVGRASGVGSASSVDRLADLLAGTAPFVGVDVRSGASTDAAGGRSFTLRFQVDPAAFRAAAVTASAGRGPEGRG